MFLDLRPAAQIIDSLSLELFFHPLEGPAAVAFIIITLLDLDIRVVLVHPTFIAIFGGGLPSDLPDEVIVLFFVDEFGGALKVMNLYPLSYH